MKCMPLKLIPRMREDEPYCKWVFWLGDIMAGDPKGYVAEIKKEIEKKGAPSNLKDYSGPLYPRIGIENFRKETVAKLLVQSSRLFRLIDGQWRSLVQELYGDEVAWELQEKVWRDATSFNSRYLSEALKVKGSPVEQCLKLLHVNPGFGLLYNCTFELKRPNVGIVSNYRCTTREYLERIGGEVNLSHVCGDMEQRLLQNYAAQIDPKIKVKPLKLPPAGRRMKQSTKVGLADLIPRDSKIEPVCQWEFRL